MRFIQFFVAIAFATFVAAAPVPPHGASSGAATHNAVVPVTHHGHSVVTESGAHGPAQDSHLEKRRGPARKGGGKRKTCQGNSVWAEMKQASRFGDPRETKGARLAAGIGSLVEWFKNGRKNPGC